MMMPPYYFDHLLTGWFFVVYSPGLSFWSIEPFFVSQPGTPTLLPLPLTAVVTLGLLTLTALPPD